MADLSQLTIGVPNKPAPDYSAYSGVTLPSATPAAPGPNMSFLANIGAPAAPVSPVTKKPVSTFGAAATATTPTVPPAQPYVTGSGGVSTGATSGFTINTSSVPSNALSSTIGAGDVSSTHNTYLDYAKSLAQASQYSPEYLAAYKKSQDLAAGEAELRGNLASGAAPGDTQDFAEGYTNRQVMGAEAQKSFADIALQAEELRRQGNIAGAQALVEAYKPTSVSPGSSLVSPATGSAVYGGSGAYSDYQAQQTYFNLAQNFPDANIPPYNTTISPQANLQIAQGAASSAPSFQSRSTIPVTLPGGGYALVNKNQVAGYRSDGTAIIVSPAQAATADAAKSTIASLTTQKANVQSAITTADANFPLLLSAAKAAGVNNNAPFINEIQQKIANKTSQSAALAALNTLLPSLQTEYARIIARGGGEVTDAERSTSSSLINGTYSLSQLESVYNTVKAESSNVVNGYDSEIKAQTSILNQLYNTAPSSYSPTATGGGSSVGDSWAGL